MDDLQALTRDRLNKLINETQQSLVELKEEVARREHIKQENEINDLDHHMSSAELNLVALKDFIAYLIEHSKQK